MSRTQLGLRLSDDEAAELRAAAKARRMSLGELVTTLLRDSRAADGRGLWIDLDPTAMTGLRACAAAADLAPDELLARLARRWLAADLSRLQRELERTAPPPVAGEEVRERRAGDGRRTTDLSLGTQGPPDDDDEPPEALLTMSQD